MVVHGNVAPRRTARPCQQMLGSGDASEPFQRFTLEHLPLTYVQSTDDRPGADAALEVRVDDVRWNEVPTLFGAAPRDRAYIAAHDEQGTTYVEFGDGVRGARLPTGVEQRARDLPQGDRRRRQRRGRRAHAAARPAARPEERQQPVAGEGGADPEPEEARASRSRSASARSAAPSRCSTTRTSRAPSPASPRRNAAVLTLRAGRTIVVTVAAEGGDRLDDLDRRRCRSTAIRTCRCACCRRPTRDVPPRAQGRASTRPTRPRRCWPASRRRCARYSLRRARARPAGRRSRTSSRSRRPCPASWRVDLDLLYGGTTAGLADRAARAARRPSDAGGDGVAAGLLELRLRPARRAGGDDVTATGLTRRRSSTGCCPRVYRVRDAEQGGALRALIDVIAEQVNVARGEHRAALRRPVHRDLRRLGRALHRRPHRLPAAARRRRREIASPRAEVANTIALPPPQGHGAVLEQLARDVTGWPARAVEFFELLATTQYMNHIRLHAPATRRPARRGAARAAARSRRAPSTPFAHTAEMRRIPKAGRAATTSPTSASSSGGCRRSASCASPLVRRRRRAAAAFRFNPLGRTSAVHAAPHRGRRSPTSPSRSTCPIPLRRARSRRRAPRATSYGAGRALRCWRSRRRERRRRSPSADVRICDLSRRSRRRRAPGSTSRSPPTRTSPSIPVLGRVAFAAAPAAGEQRLATFHYGSALAIGGGGYDRAASLERIETVVTASGGEALGPQLDLRSPAAAGCRSWTAARYAAPATITATTPPAGRADRVVALRPPTARGRCSRARRPAHARAGAATRTLVLDGLVLAGGAARARGGRRRRAAQARPAPLHARARARARTRTAPALRSAARA